MIKKIKEDLIEAIKKNDEAKKSALRMLLAKLEKEKVSLKLSNVSDLTDDQVVSVISKADKELDKEIAEYKKVGRETFSQETEKEILKSYLPEQLSEEEIQVEVNHALKLIERGELADINKAKGYLSQKLRGRADMKVVMRFLPKN